MTLPVNIEALINGEVVENDRIEFKKGWDPDHIYRTICAFANDFEDQSGGYIVVGVEEKNGRAVRPVCGINIDSLDKIQKDMINYNNQIQPYYQPRTSIENVDGKKVLVIWATAGDRRPYKVPDKVTNTNFKTYNYYIRYNSGTIVAKGEYEMELMNLANRVPFDDRGNSSAKIALMLFSNNPEKFFPGTRVEIVIYPKGKDENPDNFIELDPITGPVHLVIRRTLEYIKTMVIQQKVKKVPSQAEAIRIFNYPYQALEEIVVNALYHRSYQEREPVEISIMPDKIEIVSYSGADRSIRLADLRAGKRVRARRYRNRRLGDFLKELDLTEGRGTGIPTVKKELEKNGSSKAMFDSDDERTFFFVSIPCHADFLCEEITVDTKGHIIENVSVNKSDIREQIFNLIVHNNHITRKSIAEAVGINPSAVQRHIQILIKNGDIERKGKTRGSYFIVLRKTIK